MGITRVKKKERKKVVCAMMQCPLCFWITLEKTSEQFELSTKPEHPHKLKDYGRYPPSFIPKQGATTFGLWQQH
jgi:ribosome biogenesis protein Nip4